MTNANSEAPNAKTKAPTSYTALRQPAFRWLLSGGLPVLLGVSAIALSIVVDRGYRRPSSDPQALVSLAVMSGIASMLLVETFKRLLPIRARFQEHQLDRLVGALDVKRDRTKASSSRIWPQPTTLLVTGVNRMRRRYGPGPLIDSPFHLPAEQLVAQLSAEVDIAFERTARSLRNVDASVREEGRGSDEMRATQQALAVMLDDLQILLTLRWRHYVQATAWWMSAWVALLACATTTVDVAALHATLLTLAIGGAIAWVARDVTAVVERWRR